jgi:hypothetical protein
MEEEQKSDQDILQRNYTGISSFQSLFNRISFNKVYIFITPKYISTTIHRIYTWRKNTVR